jgi:hypothetical protein
MQICNNKNKYPLDVDAPRVKYYCQINIGINDYLVEDLCI